MPSQRRQHWAPGAPHRVTFPTAISLPGEEALGCVLKGAEEGCNEAEFIEERCAELPLMGRKRSLCIHHLDQGWSLNTALVSGHCVFEKSVPGVQ